MASVASIGPLLVEAARPVELDAVVQHGEAGAWGLAFGDGRIVEATFLADSGMLVFETDLGIPATRDTAALHRLLLGYSYLWRETGGLHISLAAPESRAFLTYGSLRRIRARPCRSMSSAAWSRGALARRPRWCWWLGPAAQRRRRTPESGDRQC